MEFLNRSDAAAVAEFEEFVFRHQNGFYLQSTYWASIKEDWHWEAVVTRGEDGAICGTILVMIKALSRSLSILYAPRGPVCNYHDETTLRRLLDGVKQLATRYGGILLRIDPPLLEEDEQAVQVFHRAGFRRHDTGSRNGTAQPRNNYILPLEGKTEEQVLMDFHQKWRYNIRIATRKGVECRVCGADKLPDFYHLLKKTADRDGFSPRPLSFYEGVLRNFGENCRLYICYYGEEPLSGALCVRFGNRMNYAFGASGDAHREKMPNHLMQWEMIRWAIECGCKIYDFGGIFNYTDPESPTYSLYRFKRGFGGKRICYEGDLDLDIKKIHAKLFHTLERTWRLRLAKKRA